MTLAIITLLLAQQVFRPPTSAGVTLALSPLVLVLVWVSVLVPLLLCARFGFLGLGGPRELLRHGLELAVPLTALWLVLHLLFPHGFYRGYGAIELLACAGLARWRLELQDKMELLFFCALFFVMRLLTAVLLGIVSLALKG